MSTYYSIYEVLQNLGFIYVGLRGPCETNDIVQIMSNKNILIYDYYLIKVILIKVILIKVILIKVILIKVKIKIL